MRRILVSSKVSLINKVGVRSLCSLISRLALWLIWTYFQLTRRSISLEIPSATQPQFDPVSFLGTWGNYQTLQIVIRNRINYFPIESNAYVGEYLSISDRVSGSNWTFRYPILIILIHLCSTKQCAISQSKQIPLLINTAFSSRISDYGRADSNRAICRIIRPFLIPPLREFEGNGLQHV